MGHPPLELGFCCCLRGSTLEPRFCHYLRGSPPWNPDYAAHYVGSPPGTWILAAFTSGRWLIALLLWRATTRAQNLDFVVTYMGNPVERGFCRYFRGSPPWNLDFVGLYVDLVRNLEFVVTYAGHHLWSLDFVSISGFRVLREPWFFPG